MRPSGSVTVRYWSGILNKKTEITAAFHIPAEFVEIHGTITPREDMVKVGGAGWFGYGSYGALFLEPPNFNLPGTKRISTLGFLYMYS